MPSLSEMERARKQTRYVYFAQVRPKRGRPPSRPGIGDYCKIGTANDLRKRMSELRAELVLAVPCSGAFANELERTLHEQFKHLRTWNPGDWIWVGRTHVGGKEWFRVNEELSSLMSVTLGIGYWPWDRERREIVTP